MPVSAKKDLYIAKNMAELNTIAELPAKLKTTNASLLVKTADKMLKEAEHSDKLMDEERAYVLFMKYFNVVTFLKKSADYKKQKAYFDDLLGVKNLLQAIDRAEKLSESLKERYEQKEAEVVAEKLASLDSLEEKDVEKTEEKLEPKTEEVVKEEEPEQSEKKPLDTISPRDLFTLMNDRDAQIIIMDVRPIADYQETRINHDSCINVPAECIKPGTTVSYIEKSLPLDSVSLWKQRGNIDHIILLDWNSTLEQVIIGKPLQTLKDALFKYDSTVIIKSEPLVLDGGYEQWLLHYPTRCINPDFKKIQASVQDTSQASLMDFDYPDFDTAFLMTPSPEKPNRGSQLDGEVSQTDLNGDISGLSLPKIDRSTKPKVDRTTKNVTRVQVDSSVSAKSNSLYPDVRALSGPSNQNRPSGSLANQNIASSNAANRAATKSDSVPKMEESSSSLTKISSDLSDELKVIDKLKQQKQAELTKLQAEHERIILEDRARRAKLKEEEEKLSKLEELRKKEQKDVADLMRMKKSLQQNTQDDNAKISLELERKERERRDRQLELDRLAAQQEEKRRKQEEVDNLRRQRKLKEEENKRTDTEKKHEMEKRMEIERKIEMERRIEIERKEKEASEKALQEAHERARQEEEDRKKELALAEEAARIYEHDKTKEEARRLKEQRLTEERIRLEKEKQIQLEKERQAALEEKRRKQAELDRLEREKQEKIRQERERQEKERLEKERRAREEEDRRRAEEAQIAAEQKMKLINEAKSTPKAIPDPNLLKGWEKQLDSKTNRYFYINHNSGTTQWEPPAAFAGQQPKGTYTAKLQDEPREKKRGLQRSNSSPNIAKMMEDEGKQLPSIDRASKPIKRIEPMARPVPMPAKRRDLNPVYGNVGSALTGLRNLGNTCYMNSTIQCLNNTSPLITYLVTDMYLYDINRERELGPQAEVADDFAYIVKALWSGQYRFITPRDFKYVVGRHQPMFSGYDQQDSQEFLTFLLDGLHEGLNKVKKRPTLKDQDNDRLPDSEAATLAWKQHKLCNESIIVELFQGQLKSTLMCLTCRKQSKTFQAFMYLSLPIPSSSRCSLQDCLREFLKEEKMTGSCKWRCPQCKCDRDSVKKIDLWKLPRILLIALNRFVYEGQWRNKISAYVDFPVRGLDLQQFVRGPTSKPYKLYGISNHFGTLDGGHYTACCRNPCTQKWYKFDDHEVYETSESSIKTSAAYVLFYTSIELPPPDFRPSFG